MSCASILCCVLLTFGLRGPVPAPGAVAGKVASGTQRQAAPGGPYAHETPAQHDARMRWWREARFGLFIHWGIYSVPAGTYHGKKIRGAGEWIMHDARIPVAEYAKFATQFNPIKFNADEWVAIARDAGMKYIVITSKHHDGFALFKSKASPFNIVDATPFHRDPLKELAEACRKQGIKLGFYFSQAQDWHHPGGAAIGGHWDKAQDGSMDEYIDKVAMPQAREILSNYGPLAVLWWDTPEGMTKARAEKFLPLLKLQPGILTNDRLGGGVPGDFSTPEQYIPATGIPGKDWETCMTMNNTWGYVSYDHDWKSTETLIRNLIDIASKGGNYLLNVGPTAEGLIPAASVERLRGMGRWLKVNGASIYGTTASPFKRLSWGRCTKKLHDGATTLYLHVFDWPADGRLVVPGLKNKVTGAWLLAEAEHGKPQRLTTARRGADVVIRVPRPAPDKVASVVVLEIAGAPDIEPVLLTQAADGSIRLPAAEAVCHGEEIKYEESEHRGNIGYWIKPSDYVAWQFAVRRPGKFAVTAEVAALAPSAVEVRVGGTKRHARIPRTGDYRKYTTVNLGRIGIPVAGKTTLEVRAVPEGWQPVNIRSVTLVPVK